MRQDSVLVRNELNTLRNVNVQLATTAGHLSDENEGLRAENQALRAENEALRADNVVLQGRVNDLEVRLQNLELVSPSCPSADG